MPVPSDPSAVSIIFDLHLVCFFNKLSELSLRSYKVCLIIACDFVRSPSGPLVVTMRLDAFRKSVVLNELAISKFTALVAEHVKRQTFLAGSLRVILLVRNSA